MPRICRPINPMEGRDYLTLDDRVRPQAGSGQRQLYFQSMSPVFRKNAVSANTSNMPPKEAYACQ
jgi:hypothetical protein